MLYDEKELQEKRQRMGVLFLAIVVLLALGIGSIMLYDILKPLPQTKACENKGFEAGKVTDGFEFCYSGCETNKLNSCTSRSVPI